MHVENVILNLRAIKINYIWIIIAAGYTVWTIFFSVAS